MTLPRAAYFVAIAGATAMGYAQAQSADDAPAGGFAEFLRSQRISSLVRFDYFQSSRTLDGETNFFGGSVQVKALPRISSTVDGKFEARLIDSDIHNRPGKDGHSRVLEAYATLHFDKADLRVGRQIVAWGRADGINPTDNLTPRDYAVLLPFDEDQRFGTTALKLDVYLTQKLTLTAFTTPFFEPSEFPLPGNSAIVEKRPTRTLSDSEGGLKLSKTGDEFDWSVSYYHGRNLLPTLWLNQSRMELHYDHFDVLGADAARNFGRFGFRTELALTRPADLPNPDPNVGNSRLYWVAGIDRTLLENLNINAQLFAHWMPQYRDPAAIPDPLPRIVAIENAIIAGQEDRVSSGLTFRISNMWVNNTLEAEVFGAANFRHGDRFIRPLVTYAFNDHLKGTLGGELYRGSLYTPYGLFEPNSGVFLELRYGL
jgi:Protein of unknown function (DUF1302)